MLGFDPFLHDPLGDFDDTAAVEQAFYDLIGRSDGDHVFIALVNLISNTAAIGSPTGWTPMELSIMETDPEGPNAMPVSSLFISDTSWNGKPTDSIYPNTLADVRLMKPWTMERSIPIAPATSRRSQVSYGKIEFANADGAYDEIMRDYSVDGQRVQVYLGPKWGDFGQFKRIGDAYGYRWSAKRDKVQISLRDVAVQFDKPLYGVTYKGLGALDGDNDLTGTTKPLCFGECFNVTPVRINLAYLIYQVHDGKVQGITAVRDKGAPLYNSLGDFDNYVALATAPIPPGEYATCNNLGLIRLAVRPDGPVTCDLEGDAGSGYTSKLSEITLNVLKRYAGVPAQDLLTSSFTELPDGVVGYYIEAGANPTVGSVLDDLMGSVGAWYGGTRDRRLRVGTLPIPETATINHELGDGDVLSVEKMESPVAPRYKQTVTYNKNWTPYDESDVATSVTGVDLENLIRDTDSFVVTKGEVLLRYSTAVNGATIDTYYRDQGPADQICNYIMELHSVYRELFKVEVPKSGYEIQLGQVVNLTYGRFGLEAGKPLIVVGLKDEADKSKITLRLWG